MKFELYVLDREKVTFRHWDSTRGRGTLIVVTVAEWESWDRPTSITATIEAPGQSWFAELNAADDPTIWDGDEPVISRSDVPGHWDELVARLGLAP